jgi:hypothetical protein
LAGGIVVAMISASIATPTVVRANQRTIPSRNSRSDPDWDALRGDPRFEIVASPVETLWINSGKHPLASGVFLNQRR